MVINIAQMHGIENMQDLLFKDTVALNFTRDSGLINPQ